MLFVYKRFLVYLMPLKKKKSLVWDTIYFYKKLMIKITATSNLVDLCSVYLTDLFNLGQVHLC